MFVKHCHLKQTTGKLSGVSQTIINKSAFTTRINFLSKAVCSWKETGDVNNAQGQIKVGIHRTGPYENKRFFILINVA